MKLLILLVVIFIVGSSVKGQTVKEYEYWYNGSNVLDTMREVRYKEYGVLKKEKVGWYKILSTEKWPAMWEVIVPNKGRNKTPIRIDAIRWIQFKDSKFRFYTGWKEAKKVPKLL